MADQDDIEPLDEAKKLHINNVLVPELDDAIVRVANMRKRQPSKCQSRALKVASNTVKYYSQVTVECEKGEWDGTKSSLQQGMSQYGSVDFGMAENLSSLSKTLRDGLKERKDNLKSEKEKMSTTQREEDLKIPFPNLKQIPFFQTVPHSLC